MLHVPYAQNEECRSSSSQGSTPVTKWDTTFNRAMNQVKNVEAQAPPSSAGRVPGFGGISWSEYYGKKGKKAESAEVKQLREKVEQFPQLLQDTVKEAVAAVQIQFQSQVQTEVNEKLNTILPAYLEQYTKWKKGGKRGPRPIPNITSSQSDNAAPEVLVTPPAGLEGPELTLSVAAKAPARTVPASSHSATCMLAVGGGASTLAELDALKVTN